MFLVEQQELSGEQCDQSGGTGSCSVPYEDLLKQLTTHQHAILIDLGTALFSLG